MSSPAELPSSEIDSGAGPATPRRRPRFARVAFVVVVTAIVLVGIVVIRPTRSTPSIGATSSIPTTATTTTELPVGTALPVRRVTKLADHPLVVPGAALPDATCTLPAFERNA